MSQRRSTVLGPLLLIGMGGLLLYANFWPESDPWPILAKYWPLLLIFVGAGKLWERLRSSGQPDDAKRPWLSGGEIAIVALLVIFGVALSRGAGSHRVVHNAQSVERQAAESAHVQIEMTAGELKMSGGAAKLMEAIFEYSEAEGQPRVAYEVAGHEGRLRVDQSGRGIHFGRTHNSWDLRLNNDTPMELKIEMGAGKSDLNLGGLALTRLDAEMGAGELMLDLTGDWKKDLDAKIEGGAGKATIRLPRGVGVRVYASGGIGSIRAHGLQRDGDAYVNEAYGKSPVTLKVSVEGGVGEINLVSES